MLADDEGGSRAKRAKTGKWRSIAVRPELQPSERACRCTINAPSLVDEWPEDRARKLTLTLCPSARTGNHLWGQLNFGVLEGVIRCSKTPSHVGETVKFDWRGHEQGEGEMYYDVGMLTFLGDGKLCGMIDCGFFSEVGTFSGVQDKTAAAHRTISDNVMEKWEKEFRRINNIPISMEGMWKHFEGGGDY